MRTTEDPFCIYCDCRYTLAFASNSLPCLLSPRPFPSRLPHPARFQPAISQLQQVGISNDAFHQQRQVAVNVKETLLHRRQLAELRQSLRIWEGAGRSGSDEGRREQRAPELGRALKRRSAGISILTKSFSCWKAFAVASRSTRR